jgi:hypothetical protein
VTLRHPRTHLSIRTSLCIATLLVVAACGNEDADLASRDAGPSPIGPSESAPEPRLIAYAGADSPGVEVQATVDAANLRGAPKAFKRFIGRTAQQVADASSCSDGYVGVTVATLRTDGYAVGGVNDCGGYAALWATVDGRWKEIAGTQEAWDCAVLERYAVPSDVVGTTCYDYDAQQERAYQAS